MKGNVILLTHSLGSEQMGDVAAYPEAIPSASNVVQMSSAAKMVERQSKAATIIGKATIDNAA